MAALEDYRWDDLRTFLALWRSGSLLAAGKELGVNASTVGRRLDALEDALTVQLFERTPEGVIATLAAEQMVPFAESVERANHDFSNALSGLEREPEGKVRVTGPPGLIDHFVAPAIGELRAIFPRLHVTLDASIGYVDLSRGEADIALRSHSPGSGDLIAQKLGPFPSCIVGSRTIYDEASPVQDINRLPWMQWGDDLLNIPDAQWTAAHVPDDSIVLRTSSFAAHIAAARAGVGVIMTTAPFATLDGLCRVRLAKAEQRRVGSYPSLPVFLVGHQALRRVPRVAVVWSFLKDRISADPTA